jgi:DNA repair protein SbcD/Mre11
MSMRIAHLADVHLDRPFAWLAGGAGEEARQRLRSTFRRCLEVARDRDADLITISGDLWEDENVRVDTRRFVARELEQTGLPALLICGNHDPYLAGGNYPRTDWPENVTVFHRPELTQRTYDDLSVWGLSWTGTGLTSDFLNDFTAPDEGRHVLLLHGTSQPVAHFAEQSDHCPFHPDAIARAGFDICLAGHIHAASHRGRVVYPGSPEPLGWGEMGDHCVAIVEVGEEVSVDLVPVNDHRYEEATVDAAGAESSHELEQRITAEIDPRRDASLHLRVLLEGEVDEECLLDPSLLTGALGEGFAELVIADRTRPAYDLDHLARQETVRGLFIRDLRERIEQADEDRERQKLERALYAGLRALDGRGDVIRVD